MKAWYEEASSATWKQPTDIKAQYRSASVLKNRRVVFNIKGNDYRLIAAIARRRVRLNQTDQLRPRHHRVHLVKKLTLALGWAQVALHRPWRRPSACEQLQPDRVQPVRMSKYVRCTISGKNNGLGGL